MTVQVPVNNWQMNKLARQWLQTAGEAPEPMAAYAPQLARAIRMGHFRARKPLSPSQPLHGDVEELAEALGAMVGPKPAAHAMAYLLNNPSPGGREALPPGGAPEREKPGGGEAEGGDAALRPDDSQKPVTPTLEQIETNEIIPDPATGGQLTNTVYEQPYRPQRIAVSGSKPHPAPLVRSAATREAATRFKASVADCERRPGPAPPQPPGRPARALTERFDRLLMQRTSMHNRVGVRLLQARWAARRVRY